MKQLAAAMLLAGVLSGAQAAGKIAVDVALTQATLIDVASGTRSKGQTVLLKGDTIVAVVKDAELKRYAPKQTISLPGKYLMPGLWDTHVHFGGGEPTSIVPFHIGLSPSSFGPEVKMVGPASLPSAICWRHASTVPARSPAQSRTVVMPCAR